jgi:hypothetical protein
MSQNLITAITDLPAIAQNVIGGAVFALALYLGQKLFRYAAARATKFNRQRRLAYVTDEIAKLHLLKGKTFSLKGAFLSLLIYRSSRSLAKAFIWLTLGLLFGTMLPTFEAAGYLGALYYFFSALNTLRPPGEIADIPAKLAELTAERKALKGEA